jgi:protein-tyrosine phosphatase
MTTSSQPGSSRSGPSRPGPSQAGPSQPGRWEPGQNIAIATVPNLRDLGGWPTPAGAVRRGLLYRSAEFGDLAGPDRAAFEALGIRTVFDMRTDAERAQQPSVLPTDVRNVVVDILRDASGTGPAQLLAVLDDPHAAEALLGGGKAVALFTDGYRQIIDLPSARAGYHTFFSEVAKPEYRPAAFHCTTGKDRTGWAAAALLLLLGVSYRDVLADYLLTNAQLLPSLQPVLDKFAAGGGDPSLLGPVLGVRKEYLEAAVAEMTTKYGDIEGYFRQGLSLEADTLDALRSALIEPARRR